MLGFLNMISYWLIDLEKKKFCFVSFSFNSGYNSTKKQKTCYNFISHIKNKDLFNTDLIYDVSFNTSILQNKNIRNVSSKTFIFSNRATDLKMMFHHKILFC